MANIQATLSLMLVYMCLFFSQYFLVCGVEIQGPLHYELTKLYCIHRVTFLLPFRSPDPVICQGKVIMRTLSRQKDNIGDICIEQKSQSYKVLEHKSLKITCNFTEDDSIRLYWTKNERYSLFYQAGANLTFDDVTRFDSGNYSCHALNTSLPGNNETDNNVTIEVVNVDVLYPAEIVGFTLIPDNVMENETFSVHCNVMGNPAPVWEVRNNRTKHTFDKGSGIVANVTLDPIQAQCGKEGYIECTGYNELSHGVNVTRGANLTVYCAPRPDPGVQNRSVSFIGGQAFLILNVIGYPYPSYTWSRADNKPMPAHYKQIDYPWFTVLNITNIGIEDFGMYMVTINNTLGSHETLFELQAYGRPQSPYNLTYTNVTYNSVILSWDSGFDMGSKQHFIVMKRVGNTFIQTSNKISGSYEGGGAGHHWTCTLTNLDSNTDYTLSVVAVNGYGLISPLTKPPVSFTTKVDPNAPNKSSPKIGIIPGFVICGLVCWLLGVYGLHD